MIALIAACLMLSGVSKSGSPAPRPMTSRPAAFSSRALLVTAMVGDGLMRSRRSAMKAMIALRYGWWKGGATILADAASRNAESCISGLRHRNMYRYNSGRAARREHAERDPGRHRPGAPGDRLAQQQRGEAQPGKGLEQLHLPDPRRAAQRQAAIPEQEPYEH